MSQEQLLTVRQVALRLTIDERIVIDWLERGELRGVHRGASVLGWRVSEGSLKRFMDTRRREAEGK